MILREGQDGEHKTVVIVGVQRGGTSMVAGVARELGIDLGTNLGNNHEDPEFLSHDADEILGVVERRNADKDVWGWKMPHASEYLDRVVPELRNPFVIVVFRNVLAMAESQMKRSEASFENAFKFSSRRLAQVCEMVPTVDAPLMLVNYEKAIAEPTRFVDEMVRFLRLQPAEAEVAAAVRMIDPTIGYQRKSSENWTYTVSKPDGGGPNGGAQLDGLEPVTERRMVNLQNADGRLVGNGASPYIEFPDLSCERCTLVLNRTGQSPALTLSVDVGAGHSANLMETISLYRGQNNIEVRNPTIRGIRLYPSFTDADANVVLVRLFAPAD